MKVVLNYYGWWFRLYTCWFVATWRHWWFSTRIPFSYRADIQFLIHRWVVLIAILVLVQNHPHLLSLGKATQKELSGSGIRLRFLYQNYNCEYQWSWGYWWCSVLYIDILEISWWKFILTIFNLKCFICKCTRRHFIKKIIVIDFLLYIHRV